MPRIMIVDAEEGIRETLGVYSEMLGYEPVLVADQTSCDLFHENSPKCVSQNPCVDILVVDQKLSGTTGLDFIQYHLDKGCTIPAQHKAVISGSLSKKEFMQANKLGCHVLQKPVTFEIFENWLSKIELKLSVQINQTM